MAGGWNTGLIFANAKDVGTDATNSSGTQCVGGGTAYTKGSWTQLIAATTADTAWVLVSLDTGLSGGSAFAFDIGIGASGSEVAVVSNLVAHQYWPADPCYFFPLIIKAGTRIAARSSCDFAGDNPRIRLTCFDDSALSAACGSAVDTYGFSATTNGGVLIVPGTNTPSAWTQVASSLSADVAGFFLGIDTQGLQSSSSGNGITLLDVGVGASGSEVTIVQRLTFRQWSDTTGTFQSPCTTPFLPLPIKAGSRIAVRAASNSATSPTNNFGVTLYGVRQ